MTTFVLVHRAWVGSFYWRGFANLLRSSGHEVYTPSLTGLGERTHLSGPHVNLSMHIQDVANVFKYEGLSDAVLVGHSYGGMVVTGVADCIPDQTSHLVYSDAFLPRDGQSCLDLGMAGGLIEASNLEDGWKMVFPLVLPDDPTPEQVHNHNLHSPQPVGTFSEPVNLRMPLEERAFSLTYVKAQEPPRNAQGAGTFWAAADQTSADPRWRYVEVPTGHIIHHEAPERFRDILYEVIGWRR